MILYACSVLAIIPDGPATRIEQAIIFVSEATPTEALTKATRYCSNRWPGRTYHIVIMPVPAIRNPIPCVGAYATMN